MESGRLPDRKTLDSVTRCRLEKFFLYVLQSQKDRRYYVGITKDIEARLDQHNRGAGKSTRSSRPWRLVHTEEYNSRSEAAKREKYIKAQKSRFYIESLIEAKQ
jgi:putative endonuclease